MAKNINHIQHVKSSVVLEGKPKLPESGVLVEGELAINYAKGYETISLKNASGDIVTFSSDEYYTKQKLGSGFTGENSAVTVTDVIDEVAVGNTVPTNESIEVWIDTSVKPDTVEVYTKTETNALLGNKQDVSGMTNYTTTAVTSGLSAITTAHTADTSIHLTSEEKTNLDSITGNVGTMAYENTSSYSSATEVDTAIADFFDDAKYENSGNTKVINFYHGNTIKSTIDASDFIKDGMVDSVTLEAKSGTTYLVIEWNTASGKQEKTELNIGDLFEADNYYTKSQTSGATELSTAFGLKVNTADIVNEITSGTSASTNPVSVSGVMTVIKENELIISSALNDLETNKLDASAYTPTDLSNYYTKDETSGKTEISTALGTKVNSATFTGHTADTTVHFTTGTVQTQIDNSISGKVNTNTFDTIVGSGYTNTTITAVIESMDQAVAAAITDLNDKIGDIESILATI